MNTLPLMRAPPAEREPTARAVGHRASTPQSKKLEPIQFVCGGHKPPFTNLTSAREPMSYDFRALATTWSKLPRVPELQARWIGPLVETPFVEWISDMSEGAYGYIEDCGWLDAVGDMGDMLDSTGALRPEWVADFRAAATLLAEAGRDSGPESSEERWRSWLIWELADPHDWVRQRYGAE